MGQGNASVGTADARIGNAEGLVNVMQAWGHGASGVELQLRTGGPDRCESEFVIAVELRIEDAIELARLIRVAAEVEPHRGGDFGTFDDDDEHFGACPVCGQGGRYLNVGRGHWFYCSDHKISWFAGSNLFSSWRHETEDEQRAQFDSLGMEAFEDVSGLDVPHRGQDVRAVREAYAADSDWDWRAKPWAEAEFPF
jgi:hypothetical protein